MELTLNKRMEQFAKGPKATAVSISDGELRLSLHSGAKLTISARQLRPLAQLSDEQLADVRVVSGGTVLMWPQLGASIAVEGLLEAVTGLQTLKSAQRRGGSARSEAKIAAVRANGAKGGRPRKAPVGA